MSHKNFCEILEGDCLQYLESGLETTLDLTFLDPPFNQNKAYARHDDDMPEEDYWHMMEKICGWIRQCTTEGGAIYFMQREKNVHHVMRVLEASGWSFQSLIIWKKKTSAIPSATRFGKHYQIIVFATNGSRPRVFNKLRIDPPLLETEKYRRKNGMYVTDVWDDIRELTSGYFAGDEPLRTQDGERLHKQQSPVSLLTRIILSSSYVGDTVFDPFAGTGTTLVVADQLQRNALGIEIDPNNVSAIKERLSRIRDCDVIIKYRNDYIFTENLDEIWPVTGAGKTVQNAVEETTLPLFASE